MAWGEPAWKTTQRDQEMAQQFPELQYASPEELMQVDNYRLNSGTGAVSDYSAGVMQLAAYAAEQEKKRQEEEAQRAASGPMPEGVDAGSMNSQPLYPTGTQENGPMPAEVDQGRNFTPTPFSEPAKVPGVPAGVAAAFPETVGAGPVYNSSTTDALSAFTTPIVQPSGGVFDRPVIGPVLTHGVETLTTPTTWMAAAALPVAPEAGFLANLGLNVGSQLVGGAAQDLTATQTQGLPEPLRTGLPMAAGVLAGGLTAGVGAHALTSGGEATIAEQPAKDRFFSEMDSADQWWHKTPTYAQNQSAVSAAETGRPVQLTGFRQESGPRIAGTGTFYGVEPATAGSYGIGRGTAAGDISAGADPKTLTVDNVTLRNPLVVDGGHKALIGEWSQSLPSEESAKLAQAWSKVKGDAGWGELDTAIADIAKKQGYDGIVYRHPPEDFFPGWASNDTEVVAFGAPPSAARTAANLIGKAATSYRDLTEGLPVGASIKDVGQAPLPIGERAAPEAIAARTWFHGTNSTELTPQTLDPVLTRANNLFGPGIYLTDNPDTAASYAAIRGRKGGVPTTYEVHVGDLKTLDLDAPAPQPVLHAIQTTANQASEDVGAAMESIIKPGMTSADAYRALQTELSHWSKSESIPAYEVDEILHDFSGNLQAQGYDAMTHTGGVRTGNAPHQVLVLLDPNDAKQTGAATANIQSFAPLKPEAPVPAAAGSGATDAATPDNALQGLMAQVEQEGGFNADTIAKYQEITGRRPTASMTRPEESINPPGTPGSRTPEDIIQGAGNAMFKGANEANLNMPNDVPLMQINEALQNAKAYANPVHEQNLSSLRSQQAAILRDSAEKGQSSLEAKARIAGLQAQRPILYDPLQLAPEQEQATRDFIRQRAMELQDQKTPGAGIYTRFGADSLLDSLKSGDRVTNSDVQDWGKIFGPEAEAKMRSNLSRMGVLDKSDFWQRFLADPLKVTNNTLRTTRTIADVAGFARSAPSAGVYDPAIYAKSYAQAWKSLRDPSVVDQVMANMDTEASRAGSVAPDVATMRDTDLRFGSKNSIDTNTGLVGKIPVLGGIAKLWSTHTTLMRPQMMQHEVQTLFDAGKITAEQARDPEVLNQIAHGINNITGASNASFLRNAEGTGELLLQFPSWYLSKFELIGHALSTGSITNSMARKSLAKTMLFGTMFATGLDLAQGENPLDHIKNGVVQAKFPGTDHYFDPSGPVGETIAHLIGIGRKTYEGASPDGFAGKVDFGGAAAGGGQELANYLRGQLSPLAGISVDLLTGHNYVGQPTRDSWGQAGGYLARSAEPFNAAGVGERGWQSGIMSGAGLQGVHAPSTTEQLDRLAAPNGVPNSPLVQKYNDEIASRLGVPALHSSPAGSFRALGPKEQGDLLAQNPDLAQKKADNALPTTKENAAVNAQVYIDQHNSDDALLKDHTITAQQWKDERNNRIQQAIGARTEIYKGKNPPPVDTSKPEQMYYKTIADNTDPTTKSVDWDAVDKWRASLTDTQNARIDRETGLNSTPFEKERRAASQELTKAGFFDISPQVWEQFQIAVPELKQYKDSQAYELAMANQVRDELAKSGVAPNSAQSAVLIKEVLAELPILSTVGEVNSAAREGWEAQHPELTGKAVKYLYADPAKMTDLEKLVALSSGT